MVGKGVVTENIWQRQTHFLRDENSLDLAKQLGLPNENVSYSPDLALGLQSGDPSIALEVLRQAGVGLARPKLGVTLISKMNRSFDSQAMQNYYEVLETSLGKFAHDNCIQLIFFNQVTGPTPGRGRQHPHSQDGGEASKVRN